LSSSLIAADDLGRDSGRGADLRFTAAVGNQAGEISATDVPLVCGEFTSGATIVHRRQTMSNAFWLPGAPDLPRMPAMTVA